MTKRFNIILSSDRDDLVKETILGVSNLVLSVRYLLLENSSGFDLHIPYVHKIETSAAQKEEDEYYEHFFSFFGDYFAQHDIKVKFHTIELVNSEDLGREKLLSILPFFAYKFDLQEDLTVCMNNGCLAFASFQKGFVTLKNSGKKFLVSRSSQYLFNLVYKTYSLLPFYSLNLFFTYKDTLTAIDVVYASAFALKRDSLHNAVTTIVRELIKEENISVAKYIQSTDFSFITSSAPRIGPATTVRKRMDYCFNGSPNDIYRFLTVYNTKKDLEVFKAGIPDFDLMRKEIDERLTLIQFNSDFKDSFADYDVLQADIANALIAAKYVEKPYGVREKYYLYNLCFNHHALFKETVGVSLVYDQDTEQHRIKLKRSLDSIAAQTAHKFVTINTYLIINFAQTMSAADREAANVFIAQLEKDYKNLIVYNFGLTINNSFNNEFLNYYKMGVHLCPDHFYAYLTVGNYWSEKHLENLYTPAHKLTLNFAYSQVNFIDDQGNFILADKSFNMGLNSYEKEFRIGDTNFNFKNEHYTFLEAILSRRTSLVNILGKLRLNRVHDLLKVVLEAGNAKIYGSGEYTTNLVFFGVPEFSNYNLSSQLMIFKSLNTFNLNHGENNLYAQNVLYVHNLFSGRHVSEHDIQRLYNMYSEDTLREMYIS